MAPVEDIIQTKIPGIDQAILDYAVGILSDPDSVDNPSAAASIFEVIGPILQDTGADDGVVLEICAAIAALHVGKAPPSHPGPDTAPAPSARRVMTSSSTPALMDWTTPVARPSNVDQERLEKAERKARAKLERRRAEDEEAAAAISEGQAVSGGAGGAAGGAGGDQSVLSAGSSTKTDSKSKDVRVHNLDLALPGLKILENATLALSAGARYGLVGRNGIGKTTLMKSIAGRSVGIPSHITILFVEQEVLGDDTTVLLSVLDADAERRELLAEERRLTAAETQDDSKQREEASRRLTQVYKRLEEIESDTAEARAAVVLTGLGFDRDMQARATSTFSGGWRMRVALARALFSKPDLLLLDEPTNYLDIPTVIWLETYLAAWPKTLLVISHSRGFLNSVCSDVVHMSGQKLDYYHGDYESFRKTREERLKNQQREYESQMEHRAHVQEFVDKFRYNAKRASLVQSRLKHLEKLPEVQAVEVELKIVFRFYDPEELAPPILMFDEVAFRYSPETPLLDRVTFGVRLDSRIALIGPNGAGKSTLLKLMMGQLQPRSGRFQRHPKLRSSYFSQHFVDQLDLSKSPVEILAEKFPGRHQEEYRRELGAFGISGPLGLQTSRTLSGGQKSRVVLALMAMARPHVLVLDEPTNHLDMDSVDALAEALAAFKGGVVLVSHDEYLIERVCSELLVCEGGAVRAFPSDFKDYKKRLQAMATL